MRIGIIGGGNIGGTIGRAFLGAGHEVRFGVRDPAKYAELAAAGATVTDAAGAVAGAEAVLLAVPGAQAEAVLGEIGAHLDGVVVLDATNNLAAGAPMNARDAVARAAPGATYYRAFNTMGWESFAQPVFPGGERADLFYAGADGDARSEVEGLIADVGLRPVWVGDDEQLDAVDGIVRLWFALALGRGTGRHTAFRMLTDHAA
jgi:8-hydroxy-5-deazaflavin:NADPH oxidoreductase